MKGKVKWFNAAKGYGFIVEVGKERDVYVHFSDIKMNGFKTLTENQEVNFDLVNTEKGLAAKEVFVS